MLTVIKNFKLVSVSKELTAKLESFKKIQLYSESKHFIGWKICSGESGLFTFSNTFIKDSEFFFAIPQAGCRPRKAYFSHPAPDRKVAVSCFPAMPGCPSTHTNFTVFFASSLLGLLMQSNTRPEFTSQDLNALSAA